ncbi:putative pseudouridylate synthase 7-like-like protein-like [Apostichopus japonicus]|uniref:Putative pseudouridylate synthase 7-like-like protein-like n=1 Tax=Stichopus japonicus TaxID=307972 RepID=A0A2G8JTJ7_STIJA|nr:putative pseudouridylate synthase 7-like-like protein-like [Apostichopus japonicus]
MFGMICFRSESPRIKGCIKTRPSDFQVTEINLSGKDAVLSLPDKDVSTSETLHIIPIQQDRNIIKEDQPTSLDSHQDMRKLVPITIDNENTSVLLTSVLEDDIYKNIQDYAETQRARINKSAPPKLDETDRISPLSLGIFHEKKQRTQLYSAVKSQFPHLHAVVDNDHEMKISVDDMYLTFRSLLSEEDSDNLLRFVSRREVNETLDLDHMTCKSVRTDVHRLIHRHYGSLIESKTFTRDTDGISKSWIQLRIKEKSRGQKRKSDHTKDKIFYTGFTLWKNNLETLDAIQIIARAIRVQPSDISYAGIKDKRAITMQFMAVNQPLHR